MWKIVAVVSLCLVTLTAFCQSAPKYQVASILEVKPHQKADATAPEVNSYDVTVKVGDTIYVVLYTPGAGENGAKYAAGRDLLVQVGKQTITYNDIMGQSFEVSIKSQRPAAAGKNGDPR